MATKAKKKTETGESVIRIEGMHKWFGNFHALKDIDLEVFQGEKIVICGPSGSGKSTLIRCINRLEEHQQGIINVHGTNLTNDLKDIETIRSDVGMVFQSFNLFPHLTILENCVLAPIWVRKMPRKEAEEIAMNLLERVKIPEQALKYPGQLSGGQQQRVAVSRALATRPEIIFADEPTGNLDSTTGNEILSFMRSAVDEFGQTIVMVTHDPVAASYANRVIFLVDGKIVDELREPTPDGVLDMMKSLGD